MKPSIFLAALYVFFLTFSLLSLFFGETGVAVLEKIHSRNQLLSRNLSVLDAKHDDLIAKLTSLRSDPESILIGARSLGLYQKNEKVVLFNNQNSIHSLPDAGGILHLASLMQTDGILLRMFASVSVIIFLLFSLIVWKLRDAAQTR